MGWGGKCSGGIDCACASHFASTLPWLIMYCRGLPLLLARALALRFPLPAYGLFLLARALALRFPLPAYGLFLLARALHFAFLSLLMICFCWLVLCTSPLVDFPLVSPCRSKKALAFLDCRAVALSDRNFKSSFVQAQQLLSFLSGTACSLRTLYPLTVSFTTLILSQHHLLQLPFHFNTTLISISI